MKPYDWQHWTDPLGDTKQPSAWLLIARAARDSLSFRRYIEGAERARWPLVALHG